jgi:hypothetical protein
MSSHSTQAAFTPTRRRSPRPLPLIGAAAATSAVWLLADKAFGVDLRQPAFGSSTPTSLNAGFVAAVGATAALLGWGLLASFERFNAHAGRLWLIAAIGALVLSLSGPLSGHGVSAGDRFALVCTHLAAAAAVIPLLYRSARTLPDRLDQHEAR